MASALGDLAGRAHGVERTSAAARRHVLIMAPAALHRQTDPRAITKSFVDVSTRLLLWSMAPLAFSVCIDFYLVAQVIVDNVLGAVFAALLVTVFAVLWLVLPHVRRMQSAIGGSALRAKSSWKNKVSAYDLTDDLK
jgi:Family of unknown function (DUF6328)